MTQGFRHEALFYDGPAGFVDALGPFVSDGLDAGEPVLVAVRAVNAARLRATLGTAAERVSFLEMQVAGRNPGRIISLWHDFVDSGAPATAAVRGIGEPIWPGRTPEEIVECQHHEELLNAAFARSDFWLVCPYDIEGLETEVLNAALGSHPYASMRMEPDGKPSYEMPIGAGVLGADLGPAIGDLVYSASIETYEALVLDQVLDQAGWLAKHRRDALIRAFHGLLLTCDGTCRLSFWLAETRLVCEVTDESHLTDGLAGRRRPTRRGDRRSALWHAHQVGDLVQVRSSRRAGTTVRITIDRT